MPALPESDQTVGQARIQAATRLAEAGIESAALDAVLLQRAVLGVDRTGLVMRDQEAFEDEQAAQYEKLVQRRMAGEPIAYILRRKAFYNVELYVDERVLIPRPETERLVEIALDWLKRNPGARRVVDVGTGSGAIALALATALPDRTDVEIVAGDVSSDALRVAATNRERLGLTGRVRLVQTHLLDGLDGSFDLLLANLPYLNSQQRDPSTALEPELALYAGADGFDLYRELIRRLPEVLAPQGLFVAEIDPSQADTGLTLVRQVTPYEATVLTDMAGRDRFLLAGNLPDHGHRKTGA